MEWWAWVDLNHRPRPYQGLLCCYMYSIMRLPAEQAAKANTGISPVRVNAVSPGIVETPIWDDLPREKRREMFESTAAKLPVRKIGQPDDIAKAVLFLMTTTYATGSTVRVDGGGVIA